MALRAPYGRCRLAGDPACRSPHRRSSSPVAPLTLSLRGSTSNPLGWQPPLVFLSLSLSVVYHQLFMAVLGLEGLLGWEGW
uniref:Uncharacterized protein n=1 Tax=Fagus sylvatica TaxID=28930 RepID=A0A2N9ERP9_FAGSY